MDEIKDISFEEIVEQNKRRIHYHMHALHIRDPHNEYYQEGLVAMWNAYRTYQPDKGPLSTYFNYVIRNRLIDLIRKNNREQVNMLDYIEHYKIAETDGLYNTNGQVKYPIVSLPKRTINTEPLWNQIKNTLTIKQWTWLESFVVKDMSLQEIAEQEEVTVEAVKSWAREARKKIRRLDLMEYLK